MERREPDRRGRRGAAPCVFGGWRIVSRHVGGVEPGRPVRTWVSRAAGRSPEAGGFEGHWGRGGGQQWRMEVDVRTKAGRREVEGWLKNPRRLEGE